MSYNICSYATPSVPSHTPRDAFGVGGGAHSPSLLKPSSLPSPEMHVMYVVSMVMEKLDKWGLYIQPKLHSTATKFTVAFIIFLQMCKCGRSWSLVVFLRWLRWRSWSKSHRLNHPWLHISTWMLCQHSVSTASVKYVMHFRVCVCDEVYYRLPRYIPLAAKQHHYVMTTTKGTLGHQFSHYKAVEGLVNVSHLSYLGNPLILLCVVVFAWVKECPDNQGERLIRSGHLRFHCIMTL